MAQVSSKPCEICQQAAGVHYCLDCEQTFCGGCKTLHKRQKSTKYHEFQLATEAIPEVRSRCNDHGENLNLFCTSCAVPVCSRCVAGKHSGHRFSEITNILTQIKRRNENKLQPKLEEVNQYICQVASELEKFECDTMNAVRAIEEDGIRIKLMVDRYIAEKIKSLKEKARQESKKSEIALNDMKSKMQIIKQLDKTRRELETYRPGADLVTKLQSLEKNIDMINLQLPPKLPSVIFTKGKGKEEDVQKLLGAYNLRDKETSPDTSVNPYERQLCLLQCSYCRTERTVPII